MRLNVQLLSNLMFIGLCFMFMPLLPISGEVQPIVPLCISGLLLLHSSCHLSIEKLKVNLDVFFVIFFFLFIFFRFIFDFSFGDYYYDLSYLFKYLLGPSVYLVSRMLTLPSIKTIRNVIFINVGFLIIFFFPFSTAVFSFFSTWLTRGQAMTVEGLRGFAFFAPEPSYAATYLFFIICVLYIYKNVNRNSKNLVNILTAILVVMIFFTKSLLGLVFLGILMASFIDFSKFTVQKSMKIILFLMLLLSCGRFLISLSPRLEIYYELSVNICGDDVNALKMLALKMSSPSTRFITNYLGLYGGIYYWFGNGIGSFGHSWFDIIDLLDWQFIKDHDVIGTAYINKSFIPPQSYFCSLVYDCGVIGLVIYILMIYFILRFKWKYLTVQVKTLLLGSLLIYSLFQSQISNPILWYLFAMINQVDKDSELL